ncbi:MAG: hypothetical protein M3O22_04400 [Pseudomonadota bacterium]|nr:hypothetical protein [Pseudomonadota bacterium]
MKNPDSINPLWWLWLPVLFLAANIYLQIFSHTVNSESLLAENGLYENIQFAIILGAFLAGLVTLGRLSFRRMPWLFAWVGLVAFCAFFIAGEEISWGQFFLGWKTPEKWASINVDNETSLHKLWFWNDQMFRTLVEVGILVSGLLVPLIRKYRPSWLPSRLQIIFPPSRMAVTAGALWFLKLAKHLSAVFPVFSFSRISEVNEVFIYYFFLLYFVFMYRRVSAGHAGQALKA